MELELTKREHKVAELVARGYSEKEIASELFVSTTTIHNHTYNIRKKIGARNAVDIARKFILDLPDPKKFFTAVVFFLMQIHAIWNCPDLDLRKAPSARITRTKTSRKDK
jgi:DNA-binding CsgD family transcriptional regulator